MNTHIKNIDNFNDGGTKLSNCLKFFAYNWEKGMMDDELLIAIAETEP